MGYGRYNKVNDFGPREKPTLHHAPSTPGTFEELVDWLDDTGALPDAESYRFLNDDLFKEFLSEAAERILVDMRGDSYTASEATEMYRQRQVTGHLGVYAVRISDVGREVMPTTVDLAA